MEKRDTPTMRAGAWDFVDESDASGFQPIQLSVEIIRPVRHVVHGVAALGEIPRDWALWVRGGDQLDPARSTGKGDRLDLLLWHQPALAANEAQTLVSREGSIEIGDDDADVMQLQATTERIAHSPDPSMGFSASACASSDWSNVPSVTAVGDPTTETPAVGAGCSFPIGNLSSRRISPRLRAPVSSKYARSTLSAIGTA